jgi:PAS domain S-box-containing protein
MSIHRKLLILLLSIALISISTVSFLIFINAQKALRTATIAGLHAISEFKEAGIFLCFDKLKTRTRDFASDGFIRDSLQQINANPAAVETIRQTLNKHLTENKKPLDEYLISIDILDARGITASSTNPQHLGRNRSEKEYFFPGLQETYLTDIHDSDDVAGLIIATPLTARADPSQTLGLLVNHYDPAIIDWMLKGELALRLGAKTQTTMLGESYLVNHHKLMIGNSRLDRSAVTKQVVDTYPVRKCLEENIEVRGSWKNYLHTPVVGSSMCLDFRNFKWVIIAEESEHKAFARIRALKWMTTAVGAMVIIIVSVITPLAAQKISRPIDALRKGAEIIGQGNLEYKVKTNSNDEIGQLSRSFDEMTTRLKNTMASRDELNKEIAERLRLEETLKESEEKFRSICATAKDAIIVMDSAGNIAYWNKAAENIFGYSCEEALGKYLHDLIVPEPYRRKFKEGFPEFKENGAGPVIGKTLEIEGLKKNGKVFPTELSISSLQLQGRWHAVGVIRDITKRRENIEDLIKTTTDLKYTNEELKEFTNMAVGRELKIIELKKEVNKYAAEAGHKPPYNMTFIEENKKTRKRPGENKTT